MANEIFVDLVFKKSNEDKKFDKIKRKASKAGDDIGDSLNKGFSKKVSLGIGGIAKQVIALGIGFKALGVAIRFANESFDDFRKFGKGVAEINTLLPKNQKLTRDSIKTLQKFSSEFGSNAQSQARAFYNIVSAGVKGTSKQLKTLATANKAAVAGLVDIDDSARVLVSSVNAYAKSGLTAERASDVLFATVREGQTTFGELADTLGNVTSIAANAGVKYEELAGAIAFVTKSGIKTDIAITGLRQVFASVIKPTKEAADEARRLRLEFSKTAIETDGLAKFLKKVQVATKGNEQSLAKLFGNIRALAPVLNIVNGNFKDFERILKETKGSAGDTARAFEIMKNAMDFQLSGLSADIATFGRNLLTTLAPAIDVIISKSRTVASVLGEAFSGDTEIEVIDKKVLKVADSIQTLKDRIKEFQAFPQKTLFGGISNSGQTVIDAKKDLAEVLSTVKALQAERAAIVANNKGLTAEEIADAQRKRDKILAFNRELQSQLGAIGLTSIQKLEAKQAKELEILNQSFEAKIITEQDYQSRLATLRFNFATAEEEMNDKRVLSAEATTEGISRAFKVLGKQTKITSGAIAKTVNNVLAKGIGNAFQNVGKSIATGENAMQAFADGIKNIFADLASALGDYYIKAGVAEFAASKGASGSETIAAGAALKLLSGVLGGGGGGGAGGATGASGGGASFSDTGVYEPQEIEKQKESTINITVEGSLVQQEELGLFIQDTLNEVNEKNGIIQVNTRVA